jgi:hypothetical protein
VIVRAKRPTDDRKVDAGIDLVDVSQANNKLGGDLKQLFRPMEIAYNEERK